MLFQIKNELRSSFKPQTSGKGKIRRSAVYRVGDVVRAIALCHNVTPVYEGDGRDEYATEADQQAQQSRQYQAASPDEVRY